MNHPPANALRHDDPAGPAAAEVLEALHALLEPANRSDAPGLVVGVAHRGRRLIRRGYGMASVPLGLANTPATRMRIASTSKHFTCLAALLLAEDGLLEIDEPVGRYLPELSGSVARPTLRQLMTHTAGVRCYIDLVLLASGLSMRPDGAVMQAQLRQSALNFEPGEEFLYSNGGYQLLSEVIARAAGRPFEAVLRERIFEPLGMHDTDSLPDDTSLLPGVAMLHVPLAAGGYQPGFFPIREMRGEGAMVSTVDDMLRWLAHLRRPATIGSASTWQQMLQTTRLRSGQALPYALGLMRHDYRGVEVIHHAGGVIGGSSQMLTVPAHELDIILILNGSPLNPMELAYRIVDAVLGPQRLKPAGRKAEGGRFQALAGTRYRDAATGFLIEFGLRGDDLAVTSWNLLPVPMHDDGASLRVGVEDMPESPLEIAVADLPAAGDAAPGSLRVLRGGQPLHLHQLPAEPPSNARAGADLVGRYHAADLAADAEVRLDGETLDLWVRTDAPAVRHSLQAFATDVFGFRVPDIPELPLGGVLSVCREAGVVRGFHLDTFRTRRLWFARLPD